MRVASWALLLAALLATGPSGPVTGAAPAPLVVRVPDGGVQPETTVDAGGVIHLVYLAGAPAAADVFYSRSSDGGRTFSRAVRVNSQDGSAIATGTIRGAQIAVAPDGRVHVAWNGSSRALPRPPANPAAKGPGMPMLYARSNAAGTVFEPQRNLMTATTNLDGGGSIAADGRRVYVAWHANGRDGAGGEQARRVWIAQSDDEGATFAPERPVSEPGTGVCGCCALRLFAAADGSLHLLYRSATNLTGRDVYALVSTDAGRTFRGGRLHAWKIAACPMTSMSAAGTGPVVQAWETDGQVFFARAGGPPVVPAGPATGGTARRKHPRVAVNSEGMVMMAWTEGTSWGRGGALAWQAFDAQGRPAGPGGARPDVRAWSYAAVVARNDGGFTIIH